MILIHSSILAEFEQTTFIPVSPGALCFILAYISS